MGFRHFPPLPSRHPAYLMSHDSHADRFNPGPEFDYHPATRVLFGAGRLGRIGTVARELGGTNVLLCTDAGIRAAGHDERARTALAAAGLKVAIFDEIHANPTTEDVDRGVAIARQAGTDLLIGLGGGSSMDCAKGINFLLSNGGRMKDYAGAGHAKHPMLPAIGIPTTAGTGSEAQSYAVIGDPVTHVKMACGDRKAAFRVAILDPELTMSMPAAVAAATGIDAISHAVETFVTLSRNELAQTFARRSWQMLVKNLPVVLNDRENIQARGKMLLGAHFAGTAIENSMLGAAHALANPLTARFGTTHGLAVGVLLPHVIRFNNEAVGPLYGQLAADLDLCDPYNPEAALRLSEYLANLFSEAGCPRTLSDCGVNRDAIPSLAAIAATQWTGQFNPRPVDQESLEELYRCAM